MAKSALFKVVNAAIRLNAFALIVLTIIPVVALLMVAVTVTAQVSAGAILSVQLSLMSALNGRLRPGAIFAVAAVLLMGYAVIIQPSEKSNEGGGFSSTAHANFFSRLTPTELVPEIDQLNLGAVLAGLADPLTSWRRAQELRALMLEIYRELDQQPDFAGAPSALGACYREILGLEFRSDQLFLYRPARVSAEPSPVILFIHGSLGNFKAYSWILRELADNTGAAIVAPTFGAGNWQKEGGKEALLQALEFIERDPHLDIHRVVVMALSNGGIGAGILSGAAPERIQGLVLLSAIMRDEYFSPPQVAATLPEKPLLLLHGEADNRIPVGRIRRFAQDLNSAGMNVTTKWFEDEDHFLFFARRHEVVAAVAQWGCAQGFWSCGLGTREALVQITESAQEPCYQVVQFTPELSAKVGRALSK